MEGNKTRRKNHLSFSPTTSVRNQYEEGEHVEHVNYNVNATKNDIMPGYSMHSPLFKPHSKSSLQTYITEMARMRKQKVNENGLRVSSPQAPRELNAWTLNSFNTGLQPPVSSVGSDEKLNKRAAQFNMELMKRQYGNAWTDAEVIREEIISEKNRSEAVATMSYQRQLGQLEIDFNLQFGMFAPSVLKRMYDNHYGQLLATAGKRSINEFHNNVDYWTVWFNEQMALIPPKIKAHYNKKFSELTKEYEESMSKASSVARLKLNSIRQGKPYFARVKKTLANRLRFAKRVANSENE